MTPTPTVSILLPVVDEWEELARALASIFRQDFPEGFEVIVRIDGDASKPRDPIFNDHRIRWFSGPRLGLAASLNLMAREAGTNALVRLDADDEMLPGRLKSQYASWISNPGSLIVSRAEYVDQAGRTFVGGPASLEELDFRLGFGNPVIHSAVLMDKNSYLALGGYDESLDVAQDYPLWCAWRERFPVVVTTGAVSRHHHKFDDIKFSRQTDVIASHAWPRLAPSIAGLTLERARLMVVLAQGGPHVLTQAQVQRAYHDLLHYLDWFAERVRLSHTVRSSFARDLSFMLARSIKEGIQLSAIDRLWLILRHPGVMKAYKPLALLKS